MVDQTSRQLLQAISRWDRRLRLTQLALWIPRGLAAGLVFGLAVALISRTRPWLLPQQVVLIAVVAALLGIVLAAVGVSIWPRPTLQTARYFDRLFGLKERSSTALELASGTIKASEQLTDLQLRDALANASQVNARRYLPFRWDRRDLGFIAALLVMLVLALLLVNPQTSVLAQQVATQSAIAEQIQKLQQIQKTIQASTDLTDAEKSQLTAIVSDTIKTLQQPGISKPEAVAALSRAGQQLNGARSQFAPQQKSALQQAGQALNQSAMTQAVGQALQASDVGQAADELQSLAQRIANGQLTAQQMRDAADALNQAAQNLQDVNPDAAQALRDAADALRSGDNAAAQRALQQAAKDLYGQEQRMSQSPLSQAAQDASRQMNQAQQQVAQAGQQSQPESRAGQQNQQGQAGRGQQGSSDQGGPGQQPQGDRADENNPSGSTSGGGQTGGGQDQPGGDSSAGGSGDNSGAGLGGQDSLSAQDGSGVGSGSPGSDVTRGDAGNPGPVDPNMSHGSGEVLPYEAVHAPSFVGGSGGARVSPQGSTDPNAASDAAPQDSQVDPVAGKSVVPIGQVAGQAAAQADQAMDSEHVPGSLRGVIRDYFTGLQSR